MRTFDLSPLFRTSVGFDRTSRLLDAALKLEHASPGYPPYNIVKQDDANYRITLAVAGFLPDELTVETEDGRLTVSGRSTPSDDNDGEYLHRGIAARAFERNFQLADHVRVVGARAEHGLLHVDLQRQLPEALKPRRIDIVTDRPALDSDASVREDVAAK